MDITGIDSFISECTKSSNLSDFKHKIYDLLVKILPHKMFSFGTVRTADQHITKSFNVSFPSDYINNTKLLSCPVLRRWIDLGHPVFINSKSRLIRECDEVWLGHFDYYNIENIAIHGVYDFNKEVASFFVFGGFNKWSEYEIFMLRLLVPQLHFALSNMNTFDSEKPLNNLTPRERQVLQWVSRGKSNADVAKILFISPWTVKIHVSNIIAKLNASNRVHAVGKAIELGLLEI